MTTREADKEFTIDAPFGTIEVTQDFRPTGWEYVAKTKAYYRKKVDEATTDEERKEALDNCVRFERRIYETVRDHDRRYEKKPRMYVWHEDSNVLEHLVNRRERPYQVWKRDVVPLVLDALGLTGATARWSQRAGCSCPCSPGFILDVDGHFDVHVTVKGSIAKTTFEAERQSDPNLGWLVDPNAPTDEAIGAALINP